MIISRFHGERIKEKFKHLQINISRFRLLTSFKVVVISDDKINVEDAKILRWIALCYLIKATFLICQKIIIMNK